MKKILFFLLLVTLCIPSTVLADDATPPKEPYAPVAPDSTIDELCAAIGGCTVVETPPPNQEDIPCGEKFSLCEPDKPEREKRPVVSEPPAHTPMEFHPSGGRRVR